MKSLVCLSLVFFLVVPSTFGVVSGPYSSGEIITNYPEPPDPFIEFINVDSLYVNPSELDYFYKHTGKNIGHSAKARSSLSILAASGPPNVSLPDGKVDPFPGVDGRPSTQDDRPQINPTTDYNTCCEVLHNLTVDCNDCCKRLYELEEKRTKELTHNNSSVLMFEPSFTLNLDIGGSSASSQISQDPTYGQSYQPNYYPNHNQYYNYYYGPFLIRSNEVSKRNEYYVQTAPNVMGTSASVRRGERIPLWSKIESTGIYFSYEWTMIDSYYSPEARNFKIKTGGWYPSWFSSYIPGWHVLRYYCRDWSNDVYIYVWP